MRRLSGTPELLDGLLDDAALAGNLGDLTRVNRWLGGARLSLDAIAPLVGERAVTRVLDVGTGAADIPRYLLGHGRNRWPWLSITATDVRPEIVALAALRTRRFPDIAVRIGRLEDEDDASHEIVHASLVVHHLDPVDAVAFLADAARVAREAIVINDLDRSWRWFVGAWLLTRLFTRNGYTRNDAPLSVRRAYKADEVVAMARQVGLRPVARYLSRPAYRYALVFVHKPQPSD